MNAIIKIFARAPMNLHAFESVTPNDGHFKHTPNTYLGIADITLYQ